MNGPSIIEEKVDSVIRYWNLNKTANDFEFTSVIYRLIKSMPKEEIETCSLATGESDTPQVYGKVISIKCGEKYIRIDLVEDGRTKSVGLSEILDK